MKLRAILAVLAFWAVVASLIIWPDTTVAVILVIVVGTLSLFVSGLIYLSAGGFDDL